MTKTSIYGPWPADTESDYPEEGSDIGPNVLNFVSETESQDRKEQLLNHGIRMACIKTLLAREWVTIQDCSELTDLDDEVIASQFKELSVIGLIDSVGNRSTKTGFQRVFNLNPTHPAMEFILGPTPRGFISPQVVSEKSHESRS